MRRGDLTDEQWQRLEPLLPPEKPRTGRPNDPGLRSLDTRLGIYDLVQWVMEGQIPGVCLCRDRDLGRLGDSQQLLGYWNP
jgi:transposase